MPRVPTHLASLVMRKECDILKKMRKTNIYIYIWEGPGEQASGNTYSKKESGLDSGPGKGNLKSPGGSGRMVWRENELVNELLENPD